MMRWLLLFLLLPWQALATQVQEVKTPSGITAWLVEEHALPLVSVKLAFRDSGAAYDGKGKEGRAFLTSMMLMEGAGNMDAAQFSRQLENHAIALDFSVENDVFLGNAQMISEHKAEAFRLLGLALTKPWLDAPAMARVQQRVQTLLQQKLKDPEYLMQRRWEQMMFGAHPYANPSLGTPQSVRALKREDISRFIGSYLTRDHLVVAVVGDVTAEELSALLETHLAGLPAKASPDVTVAEARLAAKAAQVVIDSDIPQTVAMFGTPGILRKDPRFYDAYVMNYLIGGGNLSSRLFSEIREKRGLTYGISTQLQPMMHGGVWGGAFATRNEKMGEALAALRDTLDRFAKEGPGEDELKRAKQYLTGSFVLGLDSNADVAGYLMTMQLHHLGRDYLDKRNSYMEAVTREGIMRIAAEVADPAKMQVVLVGRPVLPPLKEKP